MRNKLRKLSPNHCDKLLLVNWNFVYIYRNLDEKITIYESSSEIWSWNAKHHRKSWWQQSQWLCVLYFNCKNSLAFMCCKKALNWIHVSVIQLYTNFTDSLQDQWNLSWEKIPEFNYLVFGFNAGFLPHKQLDYTTTLPCITPTSLHFATVWTFKIKFILPITTLKCARSALVKIKCFQYGNGQNWQQNCTTYPIVMDQMSDDHDGQVKYFYA